MLTSLILISSKKLKQKLHVPSQRRAANEERDMKKVGDLFQELGFNENASDEVKIAFVKNLVRKAYDVEIARPKKTPPKVFEEQLSFNFELPLKRAN